MPTYEYECRACGHRFEAFQSIKDAPLRACERCQGEVRRLISGGGGLLFKGSGFYLTDYRSESYKKGAREAGGGQRGERGQGGGEGGGSGPETGGKAAGTEKPAGEKPAAGGGKDKPAAGSAGETKGGA